MKRSKLAALATPLVFASLSSGACADDLPGLEPKSDQLNFPVGMALLGTDTLVVCNANMDQRYNAGSLFALSVEGLYAALPPAGEAGVRFDEDLNSKISGRVRTFSFCGDVVPSPAGDRVFVPTRQRSRVTIAEVEGGQLRCANEGVERIPGTDCSEAYVLRSGYVDPFTAVYVPSTKAGVPDKVAVGHLRTELPADRLLASGVSLIDVSRLDARIAAEAGGLRGDDLPSAVDLSVILGVSGLNAMALVPSSSTAPERILGAGRRVTVAEVEPAALHALRVLTSSVVPQNDLELGLIAGTLELRGLVVAAPETQRAYASVRFLGVGSGINSGIAVIDVREGLRLVSVTAVGTELGRPALLERDGARLLYLPDFMDGVVWVVDVTTDRPVVVARIWGRETRDVGGQAIRSRTLSTPTTLVFTERAGRQIAFVTNFGNSTLAAIDVTDPSPTAHRVIARFGAAVDANNRTEVERQGEEE